jgi:hypothetical protein
MSNYIQNIWTWLQTNSNGLSILLSLLGFAVVLLQLKKTQNAAESAKIATEKALQAISDGDTSSDLATIRERVKKLQVALRGERYEIAHHEAQSLREALHQLRNRKGFESDDLRTEIQGMVTFLRKLQDQLERRLSEVGYRIPLRKINVQLSDCATTLSEWIEKRRYRVGD